MIHELLLVTLSIIMYISFVGKILNTMMIVFCHFDILSCFFCLFDYVILHCHFVIVILSFCHVSSCHFAMITNTNSCKLELPFHYDYNKTCFNFLHQKSLTLDFQFFAKQFSNMFQNKHFLHQVLYAHTFGVNLDQKTCNQLVFFYECCNCILNLRVCHLILFLCMK